MQMFEVHRACEVCGKTFATKCVKILFAEMLQNRIETAQG